jgi:hypothetical protein
MVEPSARVVLDPVDAIRIAGDGGSVGEIRQCEVQGQQKLGIPAATTVPTNRDRGFLNRRSEVRVFPGSP